VSPGRQRWTLIATCFSQFMILLDMTIVNVALPSIQHELDVTPGTLVWTINAYVLTLASFILVAGTLGDRYGRKRIFVLGFVLFIAFSAGCALSTSDHVLIAFRALQGVGAALLAPLSLSILVDAFEPERRPWAIGIWATIAGFGFGVGPVLGGVLIESFDWSAIFWVNVPVGLLGLITTLIHVRESRDPNARRLDLVGAALASGSLFCLTLGLVETDDHAWTSTFTLGFLGVAVTLGAAFLIFESRHAEPMLPLDFFRRRPFTIANLDYLLMYATIAATLFFVSLYFQNIKGFSALETGVSWLILNVPFILVAAFAGRLERRFGQRPVVVVGALLAGVGVLTFALLDADSPFILAVPGYVLIGVGYGAAAPAVSAVAMGAIEVERAGIASGVLNTARQVGAAVGLAAIGSIATAVAGGSLTGSDDFLSGMRVAMLIAGALVLAAGVLTWRGATPARAAPRPAVASQAPAAASSRSPRSPGRAGGSPRT
jgi:MFS transporter, DHA2 family, methylenomycin A resistance protein